MMSNMKVLLPPLLSDRMLWLPPLGNLSQKYISHWKLRKKARKRSRDVARFHLLINDLQTVSIMASQEPHTKPSTPLNFEINRPPVSHLVKYFGPMSGDCGYVKHRCLNILLAVSAFPRSQERTSKSALDLHYEQSSEVSISSAQSTDIKASSLRGCIIVHAYCISFSLSFTCSLPFVVQLMLRDKISYRKWALIKNIIFFYSLITLKLMAKFKRILFKIHRYIVWLLISGYLCFKLARWMTVWLSRLPMVGIYQSYFNYVPAFVKFHGHSIYNWCACLRICNWMVL